METWKDVVGYEGLYQVSSIGRIKAETKTIHRNNCFVPLGERIMKQRIERNGYCRIKLCNNGSIRYHLVHRIVAAAFIPNPENKKTVNHLNSNRSDNRVENLEWATNSENQVHSFNNGRITIGVRKLSELQKDKVLRFANAGLKQHEIAKYFGVSQATISNYINNKQGLWQKS